MASTQPAALANGRVVLHHLSNLNYQDGDANRNILVKYSGYLDTLTPERLPNLIVISGNVTRTGAREDLRTVANILRASFPKWEGQLRERVVITPGPADVNWEKKDALGLGVFFDSFSDFALPAYPGMAGNQAVAVTGEANFIAYPIDTCYTPGELRTGQTQEFKAYAERYERFARQGERLSSRWQAFWRRFNGTGAGTDERALAAELASLRQRFLELTEQEAPVALASGRARRDDIVRFEDWIGAHAPRPGNTMTPEPLRILISHHPFASPLIPLARITPEQAPRQPLIDVATMARAAGFHLALHGRIHPQPILTNVAVLDGEGTQHTLRQLGAANMGETGTFNEITAVYRADQQPDDKKASKKDGKKDNDKDSDNKDSDKSDNKGDGQHQDSAGERGAWRLELRLINVKASEPVKTSIYMLLNPTESAETQAERLSTQAKQRNEFGKYMRIAMGRFSEQAYQAPPVNRNESSRALALPQEALLIVATIIDKVIFAEFDVRPRILLKSKEEHRPIPKLTAAYLTPPMTEGPDALIYPASVAAWSLVLGRMLIYPDIEDEHTTLEDHDWLQRNGKMQELDAALDALIQEAGARSYPGSEVAERYKTLRDSLKNIGATTKDEKDLFIAGKDFFQQAHHGSAPGSYPAFICMPYPMRSPGEPAPHIPEIMTLDVGVRDIERPGVPPRSNKLISEAAFTKERIEMLQSLTELVGLMLTTSSALGMPRGVWDDRVRA